NECGGPTSSANIVMRNAQRSQVLGYVIAIRAIDGVTDAVVKKRVRQSVLLHVSWHGKAQSRQSRDIVTAIRRIKPRGVARALVGGHTAVTMELLHSVAARMPSMAFIVGGTMLVLLFLAFGSIILPLKAIVMSAVSISASFGVVTWIFADGHLENLLNFNSP